MITNVVELNNFTVLIELSASEKMIVEKCSLPEDMIGFAFYGSGNVELEVSNGNEKSLFQNTTGTAISFFGNDKVDFAHKISHNKPLQSITVFSPVKSLHKLPEQESTIFTEHLNSLVRAEKNFVAGPHFYMTPDMKNAVDKILNNQYSGSNKIMFLKSQVTELLSHFFGLLSDNESDTLKVKDKEKLFYAREILDENIENPPTFDELVKLTGLNSYKLKKNFKELFGVPAFKYLQNERLIKAHNLLRDSEIGIQQAAWSVGYESLSSFSNAFNKKFGFRPSEIKR